MKGTRVVVGCRRRAEITSVAFCENAKVAVFVLGKIGVESLEKLPDKGRCCSCGRYLIIAIRESGPYLA